MKLVESLIPEIEAARREIIEDPDLVFLIDQAVEMGVTVDEVRHRLETPEWRAEVARRIALQGMRRQAIEDASERAVTRRIIPAGAGILAAMQSED